MNPTDTKLYDVFPEKIYNRGVAYYEAGAVSEPRNVAPDLWHATVRGTIDYEVDVRIHHGRIIAAACTCPYAQNHTYCKHVCALTLAVERLNRDNERGRSQYPDDASRAVDALAKSFSGASPSRVLSDDDWQAIRHVLEALFHPENPDELMLHTPRVVEPYESPGSKKPIEPLRNMRLLVPAIPPSRLDDLPHTWLTILEAAYEHLHDTDGLRRLYVCYIAMAHTYAEAVYVDKLRGISGEHWAEDRERIVELVRRYAPGCPDSNNPAYERILREDRLSLEAYDYCMRSDDSTALYALMDVIAVGEPERLWAAVRRYLLDPDCSLHVNDSLFAQARIVAWVDKVERTLGAEKAHELAYDIVDMYPERASLRERLVDYLDSEGEVPGNEVRTTSGFNLGMAENQGS